MAAWRGCASGPLTAASTAIGAIAYLAKAAGFDPRRSYDYSNFMISGVLLDLAGVIYEGESALPGALDAVDQIRHAGLSLRFVTNTTRMTKHMVLERLARLGLSVTESELFTPAQAAREWLARNDCSPSLLVHPDLAQEFQDDSDRVHRAVVIGDAGEAFHYASLNRAFRELIDGAKLVALAKNRSFKDADGTLSLDAGAFVAALEFASQRAALVLGKPAPGFFEAALTSMDCPPKHAVMIGDDAEADVAGALLAGLGGAVLVRTGKYCRGDEARFDPRPTVTVERLSAAVDWILAHRPLPPSC
jgi:HAD superfamily hydrolase (TIGR01458 family)